MKSLEKATADYEKAKEKMEASKARYEADLKRFKAAEIAKTEAENLEIARNIVFSFDLPCFRSFLQAGCHDFIEGILRESVYEWDNDISIEQKSFPLITVGYIGQLGW